MRGSRRKRKHSVGLVVEIDNTQAMESLTAVLAGFDQLIAKAELARSILADLANGATKEVDGEPG